MTLLILCVDRDDDLGRKTGIKGPVSGREAVLQGAISLGLADPEESDTNAMLAAVNIFDELVGSGQETEVAVVTGHRDVGSVSDREIARQLDDVFQKFQPTSVIYVTDGAEDEFLLPLVTSRVRVDAIKRVIVRQHHDLEGAFYVVKRAIEDEKIQRTVLVPAALALVVYGLAAVGGYERIGLGLIALTIGLYFFVKGLSLDRLFGEIVLDAYRGLKTSRFTAFTSLFALALLASGVVRGGQQLTRYGPGLDWAQETLIFVGTLAWWAVAAAIVTTIGHTVDVWIRRRVLPWGHVATFGMIVTAGLVFDLLVTLALRALGPHPGLPYVTPRDLLYGGAALVLGVLAWFVLRYPRRQEEPAATAVR